MKKEKTGIFKELKESVIDYKRLLKTFSKDLILVLFIFSAYLLYTILIIKSMPKNPGLTQESIMFASKETIDAAAASLQAFYNMFIVLSVAGVLLILLALNFTKEWVWSGFKKQKVSYRAQPKFLGVNIIIYSVCALIAFAMMFLSGVLMQTLALSGFPLGFLQFIAILILIIIAPVILQIINFSSYDFIAKRRFFSALISPFKSFSKTKHLLLPYLFILVVFTVIGLIGNLIVIHSKTNPIIYLIATLIVILIFILLVSWQKIYSFIVFERVYK
jgi:hypothetical protein